MSLPPSTMMEAEQYDQLVTGAWPSWNDDSFNDVQWNDNPDTFEYIHAAVDCLSLSTPEFLDSSQFLVTPNAQTDVSSLGSAPKSTDYVPQLDPPWFQPTSMMNVISPVSSDGTTWTSPSLEFDFNIPVIDATPPQSGVAQLDNVAWAGENLGFNATTIAPMDMVRKPLPQPTPGANPLKSIQQPPLPSDIGFEMLTMEDRPPHIPSRQWRMLIRPEKCPVCQMGHSYWSELKKHILAHHPEIAAEHGIPTEPYVCRWCDKSYTRRDRLTRHLNQKHGREKKAKKRSRGERRDET